MRARSLALALAAATTVLAGCSDDQGASTTDPVANATEEVQVTTEETPEFVPKQVEPVVAETFATPTEDPGLNATWEIMGVEYGPVQGVVIHVNLKNLNDVPLPPSALGPATLSVTNYAGTMTTIDPLDEDSSGVVSGLDLPLGAGAITTVDYAFNTTINNLYSAEFKAGNVIFKGNLNAV